MPNDRYEVNKPVYIIGLISQICSLASLMLACYILPYLIWGLNYDVPEFISHWQTFLQDKFDYTDQAANRAILWTLFGSSIMFGLISYWASHYLDKHIPEFSSYEKELSTTWQSILKYSAIGGAIILMVWLLFYYLRSQNVL